MLLIGLSLAAMAAPLEMLLADEAPLLLRVKPAELHASASPAPFGSSTLEALQYGPLSGRELGACLHEQAEAVTIASGGTSMRGGGPRWSLRCGVQTSDPNAILEALTAQREDSPVACGEGCLSWSADPAMAARVDDDGVALVTLLDLEGDVSGLLDERVELRDTTGLRAFEEATGPLALHLRLTRLPERGVFESERLLESAMAFASWDSLLRLYLAGQGTISQSLGLLDPTQLELEDLTLRFDEADQLQAVGTLTELGLALRADKRRGRLPSWEGPEPTVMLELGRDPLGPLAQVDGARPSVDLHTWRMDQRECGQACSLLDLASPWSTAAQLLDLELPAGKGIEAARFVGRFGGPEPVVALQVRGRSRAATDAIEAALPSFLEALGPRAAGLEPNTLRVGPRDLLVSLTGAPDPAWSGRPQRLPAALSFVVREQELLERMQVPLDELRGSIRVEGGALVLQTSAQAPRVSAGTAAPLGNPRDPEGQRCLQELAELEPYPYMAQASGEGLFAEPERLTAAREQAQRCAAYEDVEAIALQRARVADMALAELHAAYGRFSEAQQALEAACALAAPGACERRAELPTEDWDPETLPWLTNEPSVSVGRRVSALRVGDGALLTPDGSPYAGGPVGPMNQRVALYAPASAPARQTLEAAERLGDAARYPLVAVYLYPQETIGGLTLRVAPDAAEVTHTFSRKTGLVPLDPNGTVLPVVVALAPDATHQELVDALVAGQAESTRFEGVRMPVP